MGDWLNLEMYEARVAEESARCVSYSVNTLTVQ